MRSFLQTSDGTVEVLSTAETERFGVRWLDVYSRPVKRRTGEWIHDGFLWHAFSWEFAPSKQGDDALGLYALEAKSQLIILQEPAEEAPGIRVHGLPAPNLSALGLDLYVFPESLRWTMVFTHEQPEIGPFYSRSDWLRERTA